MLAFPLLLLALGAAGVPGTAAGPVQQAQQFPPPEMAVLRVSVNGLERATVVVEMHAGGDVSVERADLQEWGLGTLLDAAGLPTETVSLRSLAPEVSFDLDLPALALHLRVDPRVLGSHSLNLSPARKPPPLLRTTSAFLNYSIEYGRDTSGTSSTRVPLELGVTGGPLLVQASGTYDHRDAASSFRRDAVRLIWDDPAHVRTWTAGDVAAIGGRLGGGGLFGGLTVSSNFQLRPDFIRVPTASFTELLDTAAQIEVYVNGNLIDRRNVPAGRLRIENLVLPNGANQAELVIRELSGRVRRVPLLLYSSSRLLRPGLQEYSYTVGLQRSVATATPFAQESAPEYDDPGLVGFHRVGVSSAVTLGGRLEVGRNLVSGGPSATFALPMGEIDAGFGFSRLGSTNGYAGYLDYSFNRKGFSLLLGADWRSAGYANFSQRDLSEGEHLSLRTSLGLYSDTIGNLFADVTARRQREIWDTGLALRYRRSIGRRLTFDASVSRLRRPTPDTQVSASMFVQLGRRYYGRVSVDTRADATVARASLSSSQPLGSGISYRLETETSWIGGQRQSSGRGFLEYRGRFGELQLDVASAAGDTSGSARLAGALVWLGGGLHLSRPVRQGFALVRVEGLAGVDVYYQNQLIGRTGNDGSLFLSELTPYSANNISISARGLPLEIELPQPLKRVATPRLGGGVVEFPVRRFQTFEGTVYLLEADAPQSERQPAEFGELTIEVPGNAEPIWALLGLKGAVYVENLPAGRFPARVMLRGHACEFEITVPESTELTVDLGDLVCHLR